MRKGILLGFVAGLVLALGGVAAATHLYPDVPDGSTHADGIEWVSERQLMQGYADGTFRPTDPVTRGQLASILHRQWRTNTGEVMLTPICGETTMTVRMLGGLGSDAATVEWSLDGGDRTVLPGGLPPMEDVVFDPGAGGIVSIFVDGMGRAHAPTAESCTP
jgi:hypothetical protein